jgi:uncharacterized membrane protein YfcA
VVAFIGGLISGWVAIGEGEVVAAFLILVGGVKSRTSIATGVLLLAISSIYLTLLHQFFLGGIPWITPASRFLVASSVLALRR